MKGNVTIKEFHVGEKMSTIDGVLRCVQCIELLVQVKVNLSLFFN